MGKRELDTIKQTLDDVLFAVAKGDNDSALVYLDGVRDEATRLGAMTLHEIALAGVNASSAIEVLHTYERFCKRLSAAKRAP